MDRGEQGGGRVVPPRDRISPIRRASTLLAVTAFHALILMALLRLAGAPPGSPMGTLTAFSLAAPSDAKAAPPKAAKPEKPRPRNKDGERNAPEIVPAAAQPSTKGEVCEPLEAVSLALADDEAARAALDALPPQAIGLANTIVVWTNGWGDETGQPGGKLMPLRVVIETALATLPEDCLETAIVGPRLVMVTTGRRTNVLVVGTGQWNWAQLIAEPLDAATLDPGERIFPIFGKIFEGL